MKPLLRVVAMALVVIFTFSSVAWAGAVEYNNLPQSQPQVGVQGNQDTQLDTKIILPPAKHNPPAKYNPPVIHNPPAKHNPPVVHNPPAKHNPPVVHTAPVKHNPPVVHNANHNKQYRYNAQRYHHWNNTTWPHDRPWHRYINDWNWFIGLGVVGLGAYYVDTNYDRVMYVHFEPESKVYVQEIKTRYGDYNYRERISGFGGEGWRYYWTGEKNIICVFVRDDGYTHTFIWNRAETERQAITLGLLTVEQLAVYGPYNADMPPTLAEEYIKLVIWSQTEWK